MSEAETAAKAYDWKGALRALEGKEPPPKLREALAALAVQGRRLCFAVDAFGERVIRAQSDPKGRELPAAACLRWPEAEEREAALAAYGAAKAAVCYLSKAWAEPSAPPAADDSGRAFALAVAAELAERFPGPCSAIRGSLAGAEYAGGCSLDDARRLVRRFLSSLSLMRLSAELRATLHEGGDGRPAIPPPPSGAAA